MLALDAEPMDHVTIDWSAIVGFFLTAALSVWAWVVKKFGEQHIETLKDLALEIREMRKELNKLTERVIAVEIRQNYMDGAE